VAPGRPRQPRGAAGATEPAGNEILGNVVSAVADGIVVVDTAGVVRYGNPAAQELFGRSPEELVGVELGFPVAPGETSDIDLLLPDGGTHVVEMRVTETTWEAEPVYVAALRDVGARWHVERELKAAVEQRDTVMAVAAHEMRTPLAVILGMAEILRDGWAGLSEDRRLHLVDLIDKQAHHLRHVVRKLLTLSRIEAGVLGAEPVAFDTSELVLSRLPELADRSRDVRVACVPGLIAYADADHLWQILANYVENAFKYGSPPVDVSATERDGWVELRVCDCGPGVPGEFVPRLFERFSRGPGAQLQAEGVGLGLSIVRSLAEASGGETWYEPGEPAGACFGVRVPSGLATAEPGPGSLVSGILEDGTGRTPHFGPTQ
jgi:signal transduction histidine kinase